ncbi:MAG: hypothetical protein ACK5PB_13325 [Pirellula sp.]
MSRAKWNSVYPAKGKLELIPKRRNQHILATGRPTEANARVDGSDKAV